MDNFKSKTSISLVKIEKLIDGHVVFTFSDNFTTRKHYDFLDCTDLYLKMKRS